jgi:hypothetical protein
MFAILNLGLLCIEIILIVAWFLDPKESYISVIVILGVLLAIMESYRRFLIKGHE